MEQSDAELVRISILRGAGGDSLTMELPSSSSTAELKTAITELTGIEYKEQNLLAGALILTDTDTVGSLAESGTLSLTLICTLEPEVLDTLNRLRARNVDRWGLDHACLEVAERFFSGGMSDPIVERRRNAAVQLEFHLAIIDVLRDFHEAQSRHARGGRVNSCLDSNQHHLCAALADLCMAVQSDEGEHFAEARRQAVADAGALEVLVTILQQEANLFEKEQACKALSRICRSAHCPGVEGKKRMQAVEGRRQRCVDIGALEALVAFLKTPMTKPVLDAALWALHSIIAGNQTRIDAALSAGAKQEWCRDMLL